MGGYKVDKCFFLPRKTSKRKEWERKRQEVEQEIITEKYEEKTSIIFLSNAF